MTTRVVIVDDHPMVAEGIEAILESYDDLAVLCTLNDAQQAIDRVEELAPDVILLDLNMPVLSGLAATEIILERRPDTRIVILSMHDSPEYISTALSHGARGYLLKDVPTEEIKTAIDAVMRGERISVHGCAQGAAARHARWPRPADLARADHPAATGRRALQQGSGRAARYLGAHGRDPPQEPASASWASRPRPG